MIQKIFYSSAKTDEEYAALLKKRIRIYAILIFIGICTIAALSTAKYIFKISIPDFTDGFFYGLGSALIIASMMSILKTRKLINNPEKLRAARISAGDERNQQLADTALKYTFFVGFIAMYIAIFITAIFIPHAAIALAAAALGLFLTYIIILSILYRRS